MAFDNVNLYALNTKYHHKTLSTKVLELLQLSPWMSSILSPHFLLGNLISGFKVYRFFSFDIVYFIALFLHKLHMNGIINIFL